jgi:hypothetical protein
MAAAGGNPSTALHGWLRANELEALLYAEGIPDRADLIECWIQDRIPGLYRLFVGGVDGGMDDSVEIVPDWKEWLRKPVTIYFAESSVFCLCTNHPRFGAAWAPVDIRFDDAVVLQLVAALKGKSKPVPLEIVAPETPASLAAEPTPPAPATETVVPSLSTQEPPARTSAPGRRSRRETEPKVKAAWAEADRLRNKGYSETAACTTAAGGDVAMRSHLLRARRYARDKIPEK